MKLTGIVGILQPKKIFASNDRLIPDTLTI
jgi:hypothetical protein